MSSNAGVDKTVSKAAEKEITRFLKDERDRAKGYVPESLAVDEVMEKYGLDKKQYKSMRKIFNQEKKQLVSEIQKFTNDVWSVVGNGQYSYEAMLKKAKSMLSENPNKYDITANSRKFHLFAENLLNLVGPESSKLVHGGRNRSEVSKKLGSVSYPGLKPGKFEADSSDKAVLDQIRMLAERNVPMHAATVSQNIQYGEGNKSGNPDQVVMNAKFETQNDIKACHVHPLLVALFAPNVPALEDRFLNTFMAGIIRDRMLNHSVRSRQDFELYMDLTQDRNDSICSPEGNVFLDLQRRVNMQELMRRSVFHMRNGKFFACDAHAFLNAVDSCRQSPFDAPHLMYTRDEATILRRLCNAFAYRPTRVSTHPLFMQANMPVSTGTVHPLTCIHVNVPVRNSPKYLEAREDAANPLYPGGKWSTNADNIQQLMPDRNQPTQLSWFVQNGVAMPRNQNILYTRNVIFFYVNRRHFTTFSNQTEYFFDKLPLSVAGLQYINDYPVHAPEQLQRNQGFTADGEDANRYWLRSVVCTRPSPNSNFVGNDLYKPKYAAGCTAVVVKRGDDAAYEGLMEYDPWKIENGDSVWTKYDVAYDTCFAHGANGTGALGMGAGYGNSLVRTRSGPTGSVEDSLTAVGCADVGADAPVITGAADPADNTVLPGFNDGKSANALEGGKLYTIGYKIRHYGTIFVYSREETEVANPLLKETLMRR